MVPLIRYFPCFGGRAGHARTLIVVGISRLDQNSAHVLFDLSWQRLQGLLHLVPPCSDRDSLKVDPNSSFWTVQDYGGLHLNHRLFAPTLTEMILEAQFKKRSDCGDPTLD